MTTEAVSLFTVVGNCSKATPRRMSPVDELLPIAEPHWIDIGYP